MDKLLPCPHCGEPAEVFRGPTGYFHVTCSNEYCAKGKSTEELAIKSYNRRTPSKRERALEEFYEAYEWWKEVNEWMYKGKLSAWTELMNTYQHALNCKKSTRAALDAKETE